MIMVKLVNNLRESWWSSKNSSVWLQTHHKLYLAITQLRVVISEHVRQGNFIDVRNPNLRPVDKNFLQQCALSHPKASSLSQFPKVSSEHSEISENRLSLQKHQLVLLYSSESTIEAAWKELYSGLCWRVKGTSATPSNMVIYHY